MQGKCDADQAKHEIIHDFTTKCDLTANWLTFTELEIRDAELGFGCDWTLTGDLTISSFT